MNYFKRRERVMREFQKCCEKMQDRQIEQVLWLRTIVRLKSVLISYL